MDGFWSYAMLKNRYEKKKEFGPALGWARRRKSKAIKFKLYPYKPLREKISVNYMHLSVGSRLAEKVLLEAQFDLNNFAAHLFCDLPARSRYRSMIGSISNMWEREKSHWLPVDELTSIFACSVWHVGYIHLGQFDHKNWDNSLYHTSFLHYFW